MYRCALCATFDASVENHDDGLVTLLGDIATNYVLYRTTEQRIAYARENVALQRKTLQIAKGELKVGIVGELDVDQARSTLEQTEAGIPELEITLRQAANPLCILLGIPQNRALVGNVGPTFTWNILNHGRILNNVRLQDSRFEELVATYQNTVLSANQDVENGLVARMRLSGSLATFTTATNCSLGFCYSGASEELIA